MKISKTSWHYRLYRYIASIGRGPRYLNPFTLADRGEPDLPKSLCPYAWSILLGLVGALFLVVLAAAFSWLIAFYLACVGLWRLGKRVDGKLFTRSPRGLAPPPPAAREKKPSLAAAYLKARKEKVCPTIRLVD